MHAHSTFWHYVTSTTCTTGYRCPAVLLGDAGVPCPSSASPGLPVEGTGDSTGEAAANELPRSRLPAGSSILLTAWSMPRSFWDSRPLCSEEGGNEG